jgi:methanesulfonate monooxygenase small subunit
MRQASVYTIEPNGGATVATTTALIVTYTEPDGTSRVYAVGRYHDVVDVAAAKPLLKSREVRLETRDLGPGSHIPM